MRTTPDALRFSPEARPRIATLIAADASGRVAQMARVCPGLLGLLLAFENAGFAQVARLLSLDIQRGRRLNHLLATAVTEWHQATRPGTGAKDAALTHRQALLLRRAGPRVPPALLWLPPPVELVPEDIPRRALENARWFRVMKSCPELLEMDPPAPWRSVARFFSKHAPRLPVDRAAELADFIIGAELIVTRGTSLDRVLCDFAGWSEDLPGGRPDAPGSGFGEAYVSAELSIRPLMTLGQIFGEGSRMEHCVRSHALLAKRGIAVIFSGRLRGRRITVELRRMRNGTLVLFDARGHRNRHLSPEEVAALKPWLDSIHCRPGWLGFHRRERRRFEDFCAMAYESGLAFTEEESIPPERFAEFAAALAPRVPPGTTFLFPARLEAPTTPVDISPAAPPHVDQSRPVA